MYRRIVRARVGAAFAGLNAGDLSAVTGAFSTDAEHWFIGGHALGGTRRSPAAIRHWYERLRRLFPDIRFELDDIRVEGPPWRTLVTVHWRESNTGTDGVFNDNRGCNVMRMRWGRVRSVHIYTDTARLSLTLARLAAHGTTEAQADPITG